MYLFIIFKIKKITQFQKNLISKISYRIERERASAGLYHIGLL
jgi:hypothetical protein